MGAALAVDQEANEVRNVGFAVALGVWLKIGFLSFGGPAAQIALMHKVLVEERGWLNERQYLNALNFCMLLPGPEAMQLATYAGWRMHGVAGGLAAGLSFVLPGAFLMLALASAYAYFGQLPVMETLFLGIKAAVLAIVLQALLKVSRKALLRPEHWAIAGAAFLALFFFNVPFPLVVIAAGLAGVLFSVAAPAEKSADESGSEEVEVSQARRPSFRKTMTVIAIWLSVWLGPIALLWLFLGSDHVLVQISFFFSKLAVVTFGGAYAVLAYMAQEVVQGYGWLSAHEMVDGLGLAETTLGPLILVTEFVGFLAAFRDGGGASFGMGLAGAVVTLWATFAPCFLWIFAGAPYVEHLQHAKRLRSALSGVTAAVVGVILNLSIWFALKVLFHDFWRVEAGPVSFELPQIASIDWPAIGLSVVAAVALFRLKTGVMLTLVICAAASYALAAFL